jgi:hypothetical protein
MNANFVDSSFSPHTMTPAGTAPPDIDTVVFKFGPGSGNFYNYSNKSSLETPNSADWDFGSGDFTIDSWANITDISGIATICAASSVGNIAWALTVDTADAFSFWVGGSKVIQVAISGYLNAWHHFSVARSGGTIRLFLDGVIVASTTISGSVDAGGNSLKVGSFYGSAYVNGMWGHIDELRISKGIARYTADFTLPTVEYSSSNPVYFTVCYGGKINLSGLTDGSVMYLSQSTDGLLTATRPGTGIVRHILDAVGASVGAVQIYGEVP